VPLSSDPLQRLTDLYNCGYISAIVESLTGFFSEKHRDPGGCVCSVMVIVFLFQVGADSAG